MNCFSYWSSWRFSNFSQSDQSSCWRRIQHMSLWHLVVKFVPPIIDNVVKKWGRFVNQVSNCSCVITSINMRERRLFSWSMLTCGIFVSTNPSRIALCVIKMVQCCAPKSLRLRRAYVSSSMVETHVLFIPKILAPHRWEHHAQILAARVLFFISRRKNEDDLSSQTIPAVGEMVGLYWRRSRTSSKALL